MRTTVGLLTLAGVKGWWRLRVTRGRFGPRARRVNATGRALGRAFDLDSVQHFTLDGAASHADARRCATLRFPAPSSALVRP